MITVIPGRDKVASPESITTSGAIMDKFVVIDPGQPPAAKYTQAAQTCLLSASGMTPS